MRIAFDGTTLRPGRTGVGYYTEHLLHHLARTAIDDELIVVSNRADRHDLAAAVARARRDAGASRCRGWSGCRRCAVTALREVEADVVHFTNGMLPLMSPVPTVVTIHDMSLRLYPRYHPPRRVILNRPLVDLAARRADAIITPSESAKRDIVRLYGLDPDRVHVVYEAAAPSFTRGHDRAALERVRERYGLAERIILYVGTIEPRKNLPTLIEAFAAAPAIRRTARISWSASDPYGWLSRGIDEQIGAATSPTRSGSPATCRSRICRRSTASRRCSSIPSMYEGFGLPVVEAMACGAPVITGPDGGAVGDRRRRDRRGRSASTPDALGARAGRAGRRAAIAARICRAAAWRARATFSWQRAARETLEIYRETARSRRSRRRSVSHAAPSTASTARLGPRGSALSAPPATASSVDVLFGQAYFLRFDPKLWAAQQPYAPLGALYAAACVRERGYRVALFDAMLAESEAEWAEALDRHRPRVAVIYEDNFNYLSKMCLLRMRQAALTMIDAARERGITDDRRRLRRDRSSGHLSRSRRRRRGHRRRRGDAGRAARRAHRTRAATSLSTSTGLCLRDADGRVVQTPPRPIIRELDALPFPAWDLVDVERYRSIWRAHHGYFSMNLATTRGCPYHCNWCAKPIYGQRYTARSPEHVVDEMAWLKRTFRPDHLWIADDIFGLKPGWIEQFAALVQARDAGDAVQVPAARRSGHRRRGARAARAGLPDGVDRRRVGLAAHPRRDGEGHPRRADRRRRRGCCTPPASRSASSCSSAIPARRATDIERTLEMVRALRAGRHRHLGVVSAAGHDRSIERVQAQLGAEAELGRLGRSRDDVSRDLRARLLSRAARAGARRVPRRRSRGASSPRAAARPVDARAAVTRAPPCTWPIRA